MKSVVLTLAIVLSLLSLTAEANTCYPPGFVYYDANTPWGYTCPGTSGNGTVSTPPQQEAPGYSYPQTPYEATCTEQIYDAHGISHPITGNAKAACPYDTVTACKTWILGFARAQRAKLQGSYAVVPSSASCASGIYGYRL